MARTRRQIEGLVNVNGRGRAPSEDEIERVVKEEVERSRWLSRNEPQFVDLGRVMTEGVPPVTYLRGAAGHEVAYTKGVTVLSGHPDSGKTTLADHISIDFMRLGGHVVYMDWENGVDEKVRRLHDVGATPELLSERFHYQPFPPVIDWAMIEDLWDRWPGALGVWDSLRGVMYTLGLDENDAHDCGQFFQPLVEFALMNGVAQLVIDHVTKAATKSTGYSRGSGDKLAAVQGEWFVSKLKPFSQTEVGEIELTRWKARAGYLPPRHRFRVGDGFGRLTLERLTGTPVKQQMEGQIIEKLKSAGANGLSQREIEKNVDGRAETIRNLLASMIESGSEPIALVDVAGYQHKRYVYDAERDMAGTEWSVE